MKIDPYNNQQKWKAWKLKNAAGIAGILKGNSELISAYLQDMSSGMHVNKKRGARSFSRLNALKSKTIFFAHHFNKPLQEISESEIVSFFERMRNGEIRRADGKAYTDPADYIRTFKAFWHWLMRTRRARYDITQYLSGAKEGKPAWVYLTEQERKELVEAYPAHLRPILWLLYDSGMRVTEGNSIRVSDFEGDFARLNILDECSKTFGRKITLTFSREHIRRFVKENNLQGDDRIFIVSPAALNKHLKKTARRIFPNKTTDARGSLHDISLYDIRHNSSCYWAEKYPSVRGLMYRFGWTREKQALYYHEFLGHRDEISAPTSDINVLKDKMEMLIKVVSSLQLQVISKNMAIRSDISLSGQM